MKENWRKTSGIAMGHALLFLRPRVRAAINKVNIVKWRMLKTSLSRVVA